MEWLSLIGIVIIIVGFILKLDTTAVLIFSAIATAMISGISLEQALSLLGEAFVKNRAVTVILLPIPMIALVERYGLKEQAAKLIQSLKGLTAPILLFIYFLIRQMTIMFSVPFGGHPQVVRPLIYPMAEAAANQNKPMTDKETETLKAKAAASDNIANFFAQNVFVGSSGVVLISKTLENAGLSAPAPEISKVALIIAILSAVIMLVSTILWQRKLKKGGTN